MLFSVEYDHGDVIEGYLIPDGFSDQPRITVSEFGIEIATLPCDHLRQAVKDSGRHGTGRVGFKLDTRIISDLPSRSRLAINDAKSGLLIYRRPQIATPLAQKIIRLETQLVPASKLDKFCGRHFQYELFSMERFGHETTLQAFHLNAVGSIYLSGRLLMRNYEEFFDRGFQGVILLADPYYEMAVRMFLLKRMSKIPITFLGDRDQLTLGSAAEHFVEVDLNDESSLKRALKMAPQKVRAVLTSPVTRQLVCTVPDQLTTRADVAAAIDLLSRFAVVGHMSASGHFQEAIGDLLHVPFNEVPLPSEHMTLEEIAAKLRSIPAAELLLEQDLIFDHYVRQAMSDADASNRQ